MSPGEFNGSRLVRRRVAKRMSRRREKRAQRDVEGAGGGAGRGVRAARGANARARATVRRTGGHRASRFMPRAPNTPPDITLHRTWINFIAQSSI
ncbi:unnamed protein product [Arctia plantaginis]|uniref:Uncharacterized protein n=1 Tax=Arctia plantaginis TaxID=874455 RepID=A0A8S1BDK7_ARCPL|nr:unnamed protein product [Arctia plantaginis]